MSLQFLLLFMSNKTTSKANLIIKVCYLIVFFVDMAKAIIILLSVILIGHTINSKLSKWITIACMLHVFQHCFKC